jgi:WD40 repeat protein
MRDDFKKPIIGILAKRAGHVCSNPSCCQPTSGPGKDENTAVNVGVAAHITAASPGGPRFEPSLSANERQSATNGIWVCQVCAKLIDNDEVRFTVALLRDWKERAEHNARDGIRAVTVSGRRLAVLRRTLDGHTNFVWDVAITPDGRRILSASNDKTVRMWEVASGNHLTTFSGHSAYVCSLNLSSDGNQVAAGAADGSIKVWDLSSGVISAEIHHGAADAKVAWGALTNHLFSGGADGVLRVWQLPERVCVRSVAAHTKPILKVAVLADGDSLVSVSADHTVRLCNSTTGECVRIFDGHTGEVNSVAVLADQRRIISASEDRTLRLWDLDSGMCLATLRGHCEVVWRVAVSPDGRIAASGAADDTVRLWDLDSGECLQELLHPDCVAAVAFSPQGTDLAVGCDDRRVYVYSVGELPPVR